MSSKSFIRRTVGLVGGFLAANIAGVGLAAKVQGDQMKEHEDQNNLMYTVSLSKREVEMGPETQNAYISCLTGCLDLNMPEIPANEKVYINVISVFGKVTINLPIGVNVVCDGEGKFDSFKNVMPDVELDNAPVVHIHRRTVASLLLVRAHKTWQE